MAGAWFIRTVRKLYLLHEQPSTKHNIKMTETRVLLNVMMGPQGYMMFSIQQTYSTNIVIVQVLSWFHKLGIERVQACIR